jgi:hypothetical protein
MMIAITPSLNASNRPLLMDAHDSRFPLHHRQSEGQCRSSPSAFFIHAPDFAFHNNAVRLN